MRRSILIPEANTAAMLRWLRSNVHFTAMKHKKLGSHALLEWEFKNQEDVDAFNLRWPDINNIEGNVSLNEISGSINLPENLNISGYFAIRKCNKITELPEGIKATGFYISDCHQLTRLPDGFRSTTVCSIDFCSQLTSLPKEMYVGGALYLYNMPELLCLPKDLFVGEHLYLYNTYNIGDLSPNGDDPRIVGTIYRQ